MSASTPRVMEDMDVEMEQQPTATKHKLDPAEKLLAKAMASCRVEEEQGKTPNYLSFTRKLATQAKKGALSLSHLLEKHSNACSLSDDMSRDSLVSCLIPREKREVFEEKVVSYHKKMMKRLY